MKTTLNALLDEMTKERNAIAKELSIRTQEHANRISRSAMAYASKPRKYEDGHITMSEMVKGCHDDLLELDKAIKSGYGLTALELKYEALDYDCTKLKNFINTLA